MTTNATEATFTYTAEPCEPEWRTRPAEAPDAADELAYCQRQYEDAVAELAAAAHEVERWAAGMAFWSDRLTADTKHATMVA